MHKEDLISQSEDFDVLLIRNTEGISFPNKVFYWLIRLFTGSRYNHAQLIVELDKTKYIAESTLNGFVISKTLDKWLEQQKTMQREYVLLSIKPKVGQSYRFNRLLGNRYTLGIQSYIFGTKRLTHTNCFQSIGYILGINDWHLLTGTHYENIPPPPPPPHAHGTDKSARL